MIEFTCDQFKELMFDYIDGELNSNDALQFENHLKNCNCDCNEEFNKLKKMMDSIKASRYVTGNELYAALVPQIEVESKKIRKNNLLRNIRNYGSVAVAAVVMIVMLVYFMPTADIVYNNSTAMDSAAAAPEVYIDEAVPEEVHDVKAVAEVAPQSAAFALPGPPPAADGDFKMIEYLNKYAPEYINTAESLYISYEEVNLPEGIVTAEIIGKSEYSVYVIDRFSNFAFDVGDATEFSAVYNVSIPDRPYLVIISFNSDNT